MLESAWKESLANDAHVNNNKDFDSHDSEESRGSEQSNFGDEHDQLYRYNALSQRLNLSSICISNIFQIEDEHLPGPLLKIYQHCLEQSRGQPNNKQNMATLRLCNYIFKKWHDTRAELDFIRDTMKIVVGFARRFSDTVIHLDRAIESCPIGKYRVWTTLLGKLKRDARGLSIGEYLSRNSDEAMRDSLYGLTFDLFDSADVLDKGENQSYFTQLMKWPGLSYARQVVLHLIRNIYTLSSSFGAGSLFKESVPSWAEERGSNNKQNSALVEEDRKLRNDILQSLLKTGERSELSADKDNPALINKRQKIEDNSLNSHQPGNNQKQIDDEIEKSSSNSLEQHAKAVDVLENDEDDLTSIDTRSFRHEMNLSSLSIDSSEVMAKSAAENAAIVSDLPLPEDKPGHRLTEVSLSAEILDNESKLNNLLAYVGEPQEAGSEDAILSDTVKLPRIINSNKYDLFDKRIIPEHTPSTRMPLTINENQPRDNHDDDSIFQSTPLNTKPSNGGVIDSVNGGYHATFDDDPDYSDRDEEEEEEDGL